MKDQYVGDVNDFFKYAFLRSVQSHLSSVLAVCWMKTPDDGGTDGQKRSYLEQPEKFRNIDPGLFEELRRLSAAGRFGLAEVQASPILPDAVFLDRILSDAIEDRRAFFEDLERELPEGAAIFFDPDNGLEVQSTPKGRKGSSKYLYLDEVERAREREAVIVYQHFGRVKRGPYVAMQLARMRAALPEHRVFAITGTHIAFLVGTLSRTETFVAAATSLCERWAGLRVVEPTP